MYDGMKMYRIANDLSWETFAKMVGVKANYFQNIINDHAKPGPRTAFKIQRFYDAHRAEIDSVTSAGAGNPPSQDSLKETDGAGEPAPRGKNS